MSTDQTHALVRYRLEQADETLTAARLLAEAGLFRQSAGRSYYAMFYAVLALLASRGLGTSKHSGALSLFDKLFVKEGPFSHDRSRSLHELFDLRQRADYREMFDLSAERAESAIGSAKEFIAEARKFLRDVVGL